MKNIFSNKNKNKNIIIILSIIVSVLTLSIFTYPAYTETANNSMIKIAKNNGLTPIETASTKDYIKMNLYNYGTTINQNSIDNRVSGYYYIYPGFTQSRGQKTYNFALYNDNQIQDYFWDVLTHKDSPLFYAGEYVVKDYDTKDIENFGGSGPYNTTLNSQYDNTINRPLTNQMSKTLVNGYPEFNSNINGTNYKGSLDYLFSDSDFVEKHADLDGLFQYDEDTGLYYYSSRDNHAELHGSTFKVYDQVITPDFMKYPFGNFLPFNYINTQTTQASTIDKAKINEMKNRLSQKSGEKYNRAYQHLRAYDIVMSRYKYLLTSGRSSEYTAWDSVSTALSVITNNNYINIPEDNPIREEFKNNLPNLYSIDYDEEKDFFFGFDMKLNFMQTKDGLVGKNKDQNMIFRFEGDDDVWVYIDGHLFLDLSGIHAQVGGEIDFHDGVVRYYKFDPETFSAGKTDKYLIDEVKFQDILGENSPLLEKIDNDTYRFKDYSTPELRFYYMERGASSGVMTTMFNLPLVNEEAITISKEVSSSESTLGNQSYKFQVMKNGSNEQLFIGANYGYDVYSLKTENKLRSEKTDANGIITLNKDEYAVIDGIKENAGKYYVRELMEKELSSQYNNVTIDGTNTNFSSSTVTYNSKEYVYVNSTIKDMSSTNHITRFINNTNNNLAKLEVKKTLASGIDSSVENMTFKIKIEINGIPLAIGTKYKIGNTTYTVSETGIINLKPTQVAIIENIFKNSSFKVEEILDSNSEFKDSYKLNGNTVDTKYVFGTVTSTNSVEIINAEAAGTYIKIPVSKTTTNPDGVKYTYTFTLKDVDANKIIESKTITVDELGNGSSNALFTIDYSRLQHPNEETIHRYQVYEEKKTILDTVKVNNDTSTSYDESIYNIEVKVTNKDGLFNATIHSIKKCITSDSCESVSEIAFNNQKVSSLTIKKIVENSPNDKTKFNFIIESTGFKDGTYKTSKGTDIVFTNNEATITLSHNESITIYNLPYSSIYNITETNKDGYAVSYNVDSSGYIEGDKATGITLSKKEDQNSTFGINYNTNVIFKNVKGYELPKTGSSGMLLITSISIILMSVSSIYLLKSKKKRGEI